jgi:hypothetical protein
LFQDFVKFRNSLCFISSVVVTLTCSFCFVHWILPGTICASFLWYFSLLKFSFRSWVVFPISLIVCL